MGGLFCRVEAKRNRVHTMTGVFFGDFFADEYVAEVAAAVHAGDFCSSTVGVGGAFDGA